ncbi:hypothetical protein CR513_16121, partial [Mucuna pruriens]
NRIQGEKFRSSRESAFHDDRLGRTTTFRPTECIGYTKRSPPLASSFPNPGLLLTALSLDSVEIPHRRRGLHNPICVLSRVIFAIEVGLGRDAPLSRDALDFYLAEMLPAFKPTKQVQSFKLTNVSINSGIYRVPLLYQMLLGLIGIVHDSSCVNTQHTEQNGVAVRKNRHLILPELFSFKERFLILLGLTVLTASYMISILSSCVLDSKSPIEVLNSFYPHFFKTSNGLIPRVFGCIAFVHVQNQHRNKLDPSVIMCVFLGYSTTQKGYKCYDPSSEKRKRFIVSLNSVVPKIVPKALSKRE